MAAFRTPEEKAAAELERRRKKGEAVTGSEMDGSAQGALKGLLASDQKAAKNKTLYDGNDRSKPDPFHPEDKTPDANPFPAEDPLTARKRKQRESARKLLKPGAR